MRLFAGIALAEAVVRELEAVVARLRAAIAHAGGRLRWTAPDTWHITLQFLGNATPGQFDCLLKALAEVRSAPVPVALGPLGWLDRTGVLYADVEAAPALTALALWIAEATSPCGFAADARPFHPHITLAREAGTGERKPRRAGRSELSRGLATRAGAMPPFPRFSAGEFLLYESHLSPAGARYEVRARFRLTGG